jgi:hypothetical protein
MGKTDRRVLWGLFAGGYLLVAILALAQANDWWLSGLATVSLLAWLSVLLASFYCQPSRRAAVVGAVVLGGLYILCAFGPWFRGNVGPWLLTSRVLAHAETQWLGRQQAAAQTAVAWSGSPYTGYPGYVPPNAPVTWTTNTFSSPVVWTLPAGEQGSQFVACGHWLCAWPAALFGAVVAGWIARRGRAVAAGTSNDRKPETPEASA